MKPCVCTIWVGYIYLLYPQDWRVLTPCNKFHATRYLGVFNWAPPDEGLCCWKQVYRKVADSEYDTCRKCPWLFPNVTEACSTAALLRTLRHRMPTSTVPTLKTLGNSRPFLRPLFLRNLRFFQGCIDGSSTSQNTHKPLRSHVLQDIQKLRIESNTPCFTQVKLL